MHSLRNLPYTFVISYKSLEEKLMGLRLFFLDDDAIQNEILNEYLSLIDIPHKAKFEQYGGEGIEYLKNCSREDFPQVFFVDLMMPRMDGYEFLEELEKILDHKNVNPSVYFLSSSVSQVDRQNAKKYSILKDFITKPLKVGKFKALISDEHALRYPIE